MNLNKDVSSWSKVVPKSVITHSSPQAAENVLTMALEDIARLGAEVERLSFLANRRRGISGAGTSF